MTTEEKAKTYDEALERARIWQNHLYETNDRDYADELNYIFSELKESESEDERIRKAILNYLKKMWGNCNDNVCGVHVEDAIAWLEKQKDVSSVEHVFRPVVGCDIVHAAAQAIKQQQLGYKVVLAFNGAYIPVEEKTVDDIANEYYSWLEKQGKTLDPDKVIEWLDNNQPSVRVVAQFKKDFGL